MVRHKTIRPYLYTATGAPLSHQFHISRVIVVTKESELQTITTLSYMVRNSRCDNSRQSSYALEIAFGTVGCHELSMVSPELRVLIAETWPYVRPQWSV